MQLVVDHGAAPWVKYGDERQLDYDALHRISKIHRRSQWARACRTALHGNIMSKELNFTKGAKTIPTQDLPEKFRDIVRDYWVPFATACVDEILVAGLVIYTFVKKSDALVPVVMSVNNMPDEYEVTVRYDRVQHKKIYTVYKKKKKNGDDLPVPKEMKGVHVLTGFGSDPDLDGKINSKLVPLLSVELDWVALKLSARVADATLARPPLFFETDDVKLPQLDPRDAMRRMIPDDDRLKDEAGPMLFKQISHGVSYAGFARALNDAASRDMHSDTPFYAENVLFVPPGHKPANVTMPQRPSDIGDRYERYQKDVCVAYGLPRSMFVQDNDNRGVGNTVLTNEAVRNTIVYWVTVISRILTTVYAQLYFKSDFAEKAEKLKPALKGNLMSPVDFFNTVKSVSETRVSLPMPPTIDHDHMTELYNLGLMKYPEYFVGMRSLAGLPPTDIPKTPTDEEFKKRFLLSQGQDPTPPQPASADSGKSGGASSSSGAGAKTKTQSKKTVDSAKSSDKAKGRATSAVKASQQKAKTQTKSLSK